MGVFKVGRITCRLERGWERMKRVNCMEEGPFE